MLEFLTVNLLVPKDSSKLSFTTPSGQWELEQTTQFVNVKSAMSQGQCGHTYSLDVNVSMSDGSAACDACMDDLIPILLGASYLSGLSVTIKYSKPHSDISIVQPSDYWPRERALGHGQFCVIDDQDFIQKLELIVGSWSTTNSTEKVMVLLHHWLDALGCWSFEDFYLSATTLLQIIAATEKQITGNNLSYFDAVTSASNRVGIAPLSRDFKDMRNNLIHEGKLLGGRYAGLNLNDCAQVAADLMNWFDEYIHAVLSLGSVSKKRFNKNDFNTLNSYTL
ncbi:hypothetical protein [Vibrio cyclitrophicus]|uniref:hypothetical protein n=1 Tax=Vibrio cyclitrophicus TaxID=47951 RepID=UPI000C83137F|nr:hypothetical protein [Vibrio cyclitrophicus]PME40370.1 hypothetical protein BCV36_21215 [Vibrio cyclitrophicus]PME57897.1 hypothetical protein BCV37_22140 [Vibrio cyclitrophicus]